jgi:hypothetical protein
MTAPSPVPLQPAPPPAPPVPQPLPQPVPTVPVLPAIPAPPPIAPMPAAKAAHAPDLSGEPPGAAGVVLEDVIEALAEMLDQRDAAIAGLVALIAEMRADHAALAARVDAIDPPDDALLPGFVTLKQAAGACGFCDETVRAWARDGEVVGTKNGGGWQVELASVMERGATWRLNWFSGWCSKSANRR